MSVYEVVSTIDQYPLTALHILLPALEDHTFLH